MLLVECVERLLAVEGLHHLVALLLKRKGEQLLNRLLVVDEENSCDPGWQSMPKKPSSGALIHLHTRL